MIDIHIDFPIDDDLESLIRLSGKLLRVFQEAGHVEFNLNRCPAIGAGAAAMIQCVWLQLHDMHRRAGMPMPTSLEPISTALQYFRGVSALRPLLSEEEIGKLQREAVPVTAFDDVGVQLADPIVKLVADNSALTEDAEQYLRLSLGEVTQNVVDHAQSPVGGVWCARYSPAEQQVHVATVDCGLGILQTLSREFPGIQASAAAIRRVLQGNASSRSGKHNMGQGLNNLSLFVRQCRGRLMILSGDAACELVWDQPEPRIIEGCPPWQGTVVVFVLSTNPPRD